MKVIASLLLTLMIFCPWSCAHELIEHDYDIVELDDVTSELTLYSQDQDVHDIYRADFSKQISRSNLAWAVQFYSAADRCGHCRRFKPVWIHLAQDIKGWRRMVKLASVPCSHPNNTILCRQHNIRGVYPTIKYFPPSSANDFRGLIYSCPETVTGLRMCLVDFVEGVLPELKPIWWPTLEPFQSMRELLTFITDNGFHNKTTLIMFEELDSTIQHRNYIAREIILDMAEHHQRLLVVRMLQQQGSNLGVDAFPSLYRLNYDHSLTLLAESLNRAGFIDVIEQDVLRTKTNNDHTLQNDVLSIETSRSDTGVHEQDLESSIYYTFWRQVTLKKTIGGPALETLKTYTNILAQLIPVQDHVRHWLRKIGDWLAKQDSVSENQWVNALSALQTDRAYIPERVIWIGCEGSSPHYRGYPCSLWLTFHTLLAAAHSHGSKISGRDVLLAIKEFVHHFYSCRECKESFLAMSTDVKQKVNDGGAAMLWLWDIHNIYNARLQGDATTEDPFSPKSPIFPDSHQCSKCHTSDIMSERVSWIDDEVLIWLQTYYGTNNVIHNSRPYIWQTRRTYLFSNHNIGCASSLVCNQIVLVILIALLLYKYTPYDITF